MCENGQNLTWLSLTWIVNKSKWSKGCTIHVYVKSRHMQVTGCMLEEEETIHVLTCNCKERFGPDWCLCVGQLLSGKIHSSMHMQLQPSNYFPKLAPIIMQLGVDYSPRATFTDRSFGSNRAVQLFIDLSHTEWKKCQNLKCDRKNTLKHTR